MDEDQLLEVLETLVIYHVAVDAHNPFEVWCRFNQRFQVEVRRDRLEGRARPRGGHDEMRQQMSGSASVS